MPLSADPDATHTFSLPDDESLPADTRPVFVSRFMTVRQVAACRRQLEAAGIEPDNDKCFQMIMEAVRIGANSWRNFRWPADHELAGQAAPFSDEAIKAILNERELWQFAWAVPRQNGLVELQKKALTSFALSALGTSAATAKASADADPTKNCSSTDASAMASDAKNA